MRPQAIRPDDALLVNELYPLLRRFAAVVAPWGDDPDDVLHSALLSVLQTRALSELDDPAAYVRRAIVNRVNSNHRRSAGLRRVIERLGRSSELATPEYPSDVAELQALSPVERAVVYLHDIEGLGFEEVAEMVGIRPGNARVIASRARRRLRAVIIEEERA